MLLLDAKTKQLVATLQGGTSAHGGGGGGGAAGGARFATQAACYGSSGDALLTSGEGSTVRVWDVRRRCCVHTWSDRGGADGGHSGTLDFRWALADVLLERGGHSFFLGRSPRHSACCVR